MFPNNAGALLLTDMMQISLLPQPYCSFGDCIVGMATLNTWIYYAVVKCQKKNGHLETSTQTLTLNKQTPPWSAYFWDLFWVRFHMLWVQRRMTSRTWFLAAHVAGNGLVRCVTSSRWCCSNWEKRNNFVQPKGLWFGIKLVTANYWIGKCDSAVAPDESRWVIFQRCEGSHWEKHENQKQILWLHQHVLITCAIVLLLLSSSSACAYVAFPAEVSHAWHQPER